METKLRIYKKKIKWDGYARRLVFYQTLFLLPSGYITKNAGVARFR